VRLSYEFERFQNIACARGTYFRATSLTRRGFAPSSLRAIPPDVSETVPYQFRVWDFLVEFRDYGLEFQNFPLHDEIRVE